MSEIRVLFFDSSSKAWKPTLLYYFRKTVVKMDKFMPFSNATYNETKISSISVWRWLTVPVSYDDTPAESAAVVEHPDCGCRTPRLHLCRDVWPPPTSVQDMTLNYIWWSGSNSGAWGMRSKSSLTWLLSPLWTGGVVPDWILSMDTIEMFDHFTVCKQINDYYIKLLISRSDIWTQLTVCKKMLALAILEDI